MSFFSRTLGALVALAFATAAAAQEADPLAGVTELTPSTLARLVVERSSARAAALAGAEAATAGTAMAGAWMDPMLTLEMAPASPFVATVPFGGTVRLSQRIPFPGKLGLREAAAAHDARAMGLEAGEIALALREAALQRYAELHAVERSLEVNDTHEVLLRDLKTAAEQRYATGTATQADALQGELMLAELAVERTELESRRRVLTAKVNGLLQRAPTAPLPPIARELDDAALTAPSVEEGLARALETRPELAALTARTEGADARAAVAEKAWLPNFEVMASYSSMWMEPAHRVMVGLGVELPLQQATRRGERAEAVAMARKMRFEQERLRAELATEVAASRAELDEGHQRLALIEQRVLPIAQARLAAVRSGYVTGRADFEALIQAERSLRDAELRQHLARAEVFKRRATYDRILGVTP